MTFLSNLYKMVDFLKEQGMFINHFWVNQPASETEILEVENALGYQLDTSITNFFRECNGVQLLWTHPENKYFEKITKFTGNKHFMNGYSITDDYSFDGSLLIEPIKNVFLTDWYNHIYFDFTIEDKEEITFSGQKYIEPDFSQRIKPFDMYNIFNEHAFFLDGSPNPPVVMGDDYQAVYTDSYLMSFADYLDFVLYFYVSVEARRAFFLRFDGHENPPKTLLDFIEYPEIDLTKFDKERNDLIPPFQKDFWGK